MKSKYRNVKTTVDGIDFSSKKEAARYRQLMLLQRAGKISQLELQPRFDFVVNGMRLGFYRADFRYIEDGVDVIEDVKSKITAINPTYRLKKKLMKALHNIDILET